VHWVVLSALVLAACTADDDDASPADSTVPDSTVSDSTVPVSTVSESTVPVSTVPVSTVPDSTVSDSTVPGSTVAASRTYDFSEVDGLVEGFVDSRGLNGASLVVVEREDGIVHEQYWGDFDADRVSFIASSSKMVAAGVLMYLDDRGLLDVDAPVADAVDWGAAHPEITPAQLLSNSSGLVGLLPNVAFGPYICQFLVAGTLEGCAEQIFTTSEDDADVVPPDTEFRYGGGQWQVAGGVAEAVSGMTWSELIDEVYVQPCDLTTFGFNNHLTQFDAVPFDYPFDFDGDPASLQPTDNPNMEAGAYTNALDYARLLLMHLRDGMCGDNRVVSSDALATLHADRIGPAYGGSTPAGGGYGLGWWVDRSTGIITDAGAYGSFPFLDVEAGFGAMLIVEAGGSFGGSFGPQLITPIVEAVVAARTPSG
jgi:CubicO group peptidase (beta-lactamase class C family)